MKAILGRLLLTFMGVVLGCAISTGLLMAWHSVRPEARSISESDYSALREKLDENPEAIYMFDPDVSYRLKPDFVGHRSRSRHRHATNSVGLVGEEIDHRPEVTKVLFLGDSVTFGDGIPEPLPAASSFVSRIQEDAGPSCQMMNAGVPGWSTHQQLAFFDKYLDGIDWSAVVLVVCLNDLVRFEWVYGDETGFKMSEEMSGVGGLHELNGTVKGVRLERIRSRFDETSPLADQNNTTLWSWDEDKWTEYEREILSPWFERHRPVPWIVVVTPTRAQVEALKKGASRDEVLYPQDTMERICLERGITFVDPIEVLNTSSHFLDMLHLSDAGHQAMADYLWPILRKALE